MNVEHDHPALNVVDVHKSFGEYSILSGLNLFLEKGRILVLFGANGSGKTTLIKLLSTQLKPDQGEINFNGMARHNNEVAIRAMIGVVGHRPMLYEEMTCRENLRFFGRMYGVSDIDKRIDRVLEQLDLMEFDHQLVRSLSHGIQKRLSIGRAIIHSPSILLLDEPESGLDQRALQNMKDVLGMWKGDDRTAIVTTHNRSFGLAVGDVVAVLQDGGIVYNKARQDIDEDYLQRMYLGQAGR